MNPAALKVNLPELERGGIVIANEDGFTEHNLRKAGYETNPLEDGTLDDYQRLPGPDDLDDRARHRRHRRDHLARRRPLQELLRARAGLVDVQPPGRRHGRAGSSRSSPRSRRSWRRTWRPSGPATTSARRRSCSRSTTRSSPPPPSPAPTAASTGRRRRRWGLIAASVRSGLPLFLASYPITPASELLHELSRQRRFGVRTVQAEDEIAAANMALGAAFGGHLGVTVDQRPRHGPEGGDDRPRGRRSSCRCS